LVVCPKSVIVNVCDDDTNSLQWKKEYEIWTRKCHLRPRIEVFTLDDRFVNLIIKHISVKSDKKRLHLIESWESEGGI